MAIAARAPKVLAELHAGSPADVLPTVLDDVSLIIDREPLSADGEVPRSTAQWVGRLRRIAGAKLRLLGMAALVDDTQLLISELVTNGFQHGTYTRIVFRLVIGTEAVVVEVNDGSPDRRPETRRADSDAESGRGLAIVSALATSWGVSEDGTSVWCALALPGAGGSG